MTTPDIRERVAAKMKENQNGWDQATFDIPKETDEFIDWVLTEVSEAMREKCWEAVEGYIDPADGGNARKAIQEVEI